VTLNGLLECYGAKASDLYIFLSIDSVQMLITKANEQENRADTEMYRNLNGSLLSLTDGNIAHYARSLTKNNSFSRLQGDRCEFRMVENAGHVNRNTVKPHKDRG
jgi:hypothetical protein